MHGTFSVQTAEQRVQSVTFFQSLIHSPKYEASFYAFNFIDNVYLYVYVHLFALMFSVFVLISECHLLHACKHN